MNQEIRERMRALELDPDVVEKIESLPSTQPVNESIPARWVDGHVVDSPALHGWELAWQRPEDFPPKEPPRDKRGPEGGQRFPYFPDELARVWFGGSVPGVSAREVVQYRRDTKRDAARTAWGLVRVRGMTQVEAAEFLGVTQSEVSKRVALAEKEFGMGKARQRAYGRRWVAQFLALRRTEADMNYEQEPRRVSTFDAEDSRTFSEAEKRGRRG